MYTYVYAFVLICFVQCFANVVCLLSFGLFQSALLTDTSSLRRQRTSLLSLSIRYTNKRFELPLCTLFVDDRVYVTTLLVVECAHMCVFAVCVRTDWSYSEDLIIIL